jgi:hypothetical protein
MTAVDSNRYELMTHGVSGTPPEIILGAPRVTLLPSRNGSQFFTDRDSCSPYRDRRVAYRWGQMTSGSLRKTLWVMLLPFALVNVATWMLPKQQTVTDRILIGFVRAVLRIMGVALTALFAVQITVILADLIAAQCPKVPDTAPKEQQCYDWLAVDGFQLAKSILVALVAIGLVIGGWWLMRQNNDDDLGDKALPETLRPKPQQTPDPSIPLIGSEEFIWAADSSAPPLLTAHAMAALSAVALLLVGEPGGGARWSAPLWWLSLVLFAVSVWVAGYTDDPRSSGGQTVRGGKRSPRFWALFTGWLGRLWIVVSGVVLVGCALFVLPDRIVNDTVSKGWTGSDNFIWVLFFGLAALSAIAFVVVWKVANDGRHRWANTPREYRVWLGGVHGPVLAGAAALVGAAGGVALTSVVIALITRGDVTFGMFDLVQRSTYTADRRNGFETPALYGSTAVMWGLTVCVAVVIGLIWAARLFLAQPGRRQAAKWLQRFAFKPDASRAAETCPCEVAKSQRLQWAAAEVKMSTSRIVAVLVSLAVLFGIVMTFSYDRIRNGGGPLRTWNTVAENVGVIALIFGLVALLTTLVQAARNPRGKARSLGVIWDLVSFWPRESHPIVPPAYAPRAVRDLTKKTFELLEAQPNARMVLCGHSQGSLLMYSTAYQVIRLRRETCAHRISLLTYGSQLKWAYGRAFPSVLDFHSHRGLLEQLGKRWMNMARLTDLLGDMVLAWNLKVGIDQLRGDALSPNDDGVEKSKAADEWAADGGTVHAVRIGNEILLPDPSPSDWPALRTRQHSYFVSEPIWTKVVDDLAPPVSYAGAKP